MRRRWRPHGLPGGSRYPSARRVGHDRRPFHGPHVLGVKQCLSLHPGEVRAQASVLLSPPYPGCLRLQAAEQGCAGGLGLREGPFDGVGGRGQCVRGQLQWWEDPGVRQRLCLSCVPPPSGVGRGGRDRTCLQEGACLLSGCCWRVAARLNPSAASATGRPPWGLRLGTSLWACQAWRSRAIFLRSACGGAHQC